MQAMVSAANDNINTIAQEALSNIRRGLIRIVPYEIFPSQYILTLIAIEQDRDCIWHARIHNGQVRL
jgi:hypothetical protein